MSWEPQASDQPQCRAIGSGSHKPHDEGRPSGGIEVVAQFVRAARAATSLSELEPPLAIAAAALGFQFYAVARHGSEFPAEDALMINYPPAWVRRFCDDRLDRVDPVRGACHASVSAFCWAELEGMLRLTERQRGVLEVGRQHGLYAGFTVPLHAPGEREASCSFATDPQHALPEHNLLAAQLLAVLVFETIRRLQRSPCNCDRLSPRQRQCVVLASSGKTDWAIAQILGLGEETVTKYLKMARARLNVVCRSQLAVVALHRGEIGFHDLIDQCPPKGVSQNQACGARIDPHSRGG